MTLADEPSQASDLSTLRHEFANLCAIVEAAFAEIHEAEARLSPFLRGSQISRINALAHERPIAVDHETFSLLKVSQWVHASTGGAFDLTIGPLMRAWGFRGEQPEANVVANVNMSSTLIPHRIEVAHDPLRDAMWGMDKLVLDDANETIAFASQGLSLDVGAIGKGHAIDLAIAVFEAAGITNAIIHAGTSSIRTIGHDFEFTPQPEDPKCLVGNGAKPKPWRIAIQGSTESDKGSQAIIIEPLQAWDSGVPGQLDLSGAAIGVSAQRGKTRRLHPPEGPQVHAAIIGHIMDPRTGKPADSPVLTAAVAIPTFKAKAERSSSAWHTHPGAIADALSTAALVLGVAPGIGFAPGVPATSPGAFPLSGQRPVSPQEEAISFPDRGKIAQLPTYPRWRVYLQCPDHEKSTWKITDSALCDESHSPS